MNRLAHKKILITGASQGLGRQLALDFAREGAAALALCARHLEPLEKVRDELVSLAPMCTWCLSKLTSAGPQISNAYSQLLCMNFAAGSMF